MALVHRAISNVNRWRLGTHRNFCLRHLTGYVAEFCWRTNRRNRSKDDHARNTQEATLPDRLLTRACNQPRTRTQVRRAA